MAEGSGEAHAIGRQHARERVEQYFIGAECVADEADMLARGAAEADEAVALRHIVPARDGDALDRVRHLLDGDGEQAFGEGFGGDTPHLGRHRGEFPHDHVAVERLVAVRAEKLREMIGLDLAEQDVAVGDGERPAAAIGGGAGVGTGAFGADEQPRAVPAADRAAARRHGVDAQHRGADARAATIVSLSRSRRPA